MRGRAAEKAARDKAVAIVENPALASAEGALWSPTFSRHRRPDADLG